MEGNSSFFYELKKEIKHSSENEKYHLNRLLDDLEGKIAMELVSAVATKVKVEIMKKVKAMDFEEKESATTIEYEMSLTSFGGYLFDLTISQDDSASDEYHFCNKVFANEQDLRENSLDTRIGMDSLDKYNDVVNDIRKRVSKLGNNALGQTNYHRYFDVSPLGYKHLKITLRNLTSLNVETKKTNWLFATTRAFLSPLMKKFLTELREILKKDGIILKNYHFVPFDSKFKSLTFETFDERHRVPTVSTSGWQGWLYSENSRGKKSGQSLLFEVEI